MKAIMGVPKELNDIQINSNGDIILAAGDTVYEVILNRNGICALKELARWTGTRLLSVSVINDIIVAGSDRGIITFKGKKAYPIWIGAPTVVIAGNFSDEIKLIALSKTSQKLGRIIDVNAFSLRELLGGIKSAWGREEEIVFFATNMGPVGDFILDRIKSLTTKLDIDEDDYEEVLLVTPEEEPVLYILNFDEEGLRIESHQLPNFVGNPLYIGWGDIDADGQNEVYIVSLTNAFNINISALYFTRTKEKVNVRPRVFSLIRLNIAKKLRNIVSDDGSPYVLMMNPTSNRLPEFLILWEEPDSDELYKSIIWPIRVAITGKIHTIKSSLREYVIRKLVCNDIDKDGEDELIVLTDAGIKVLDIETKSQEVNFKNVNTIYFPTQIKQILSRNNEILVSGPIIDDGSPVWSIISLNPSGKEISYLSSLKPISEMIFSKKDIVFISHSDGSLSILKGEYKLESSDINLNSFALDEMGDLIYSTDNRIRRLNITSTTTKVNEIMRLDNRILNIIKDVEKTAKGVLCYNDEEKSIEILDLAGNKVNSFKIKEICDIWHVFMVNLDGDDALVLFVPNEVLVMSLEGNILQRFEISYDKSNILMNDFDDDGVPEILMISNDELYYINLRDNRLLRTELHNVTALTREQVSKSKIILAFQNNWLAEYDFNEVIANVSSQL